MRTKSHVFHSLKKFNVLLDNQTSMDLKVLRTYIFTLFNFKSFVMTMELKHKTSPYTPQHNGLVMYEWDIDGEK